MVTLTSMSGDIEKFTQDIREILATQSDQGTVMETVVKVLEGAQKDYC